MAKSKGIFYSKRLYLFPSGLSAAILSATFFFPEVFNPQVVVLFYWMMGSILLFILTRILRSNLDRQAEINEELVQQKQYLENLIEGAPEAIVWGDSQQKIKYVNKKFVDMFGYTSAEAIGKNIDKLLTDANQLEDARRVTESVSKGQTQQFDGIRLRKSGESFHVSIVGAPVRSLAGELEVFGLYRDTTEDWEREQRLLRSERELRDLSDQLSDGNNFKELLLDIITHDLRNPASVISGGLELLRQGPVEDDVLALIEGSVHNLLTTIESASTLSKLGIGEEISLSSMDIVPTIREVAKTFDSQLQHADMDLELNLPESLFVTANPIVGEVISNYLSNGIKYAKAGKRLILGVESVDNQTQLTVTDFGATIAENHREEIFRRRIQLSEGPRIGSGLGLAIVKRIALANKASAGVIPNSPQGNVFFFRFSPSQGD